MGAGCRERARVKAGELSGATEVTQVRDDGSLDIMASVEVVRNGQALDIL